MRGHGTHKAAIEMAERAKEKADHAEIRTLVDDIISAQENEITTLKHIGKDLPGREAGGGPHGHERRQDGHGHVPAMLDNAEPFDRAFIDMMVPHHEGAVAMAEQLLEDGEHRNLQAMARDIIGRRPGRSPR